MRPDPTIVAIMGPTASGKSDLALRLINYFPCEIISVDSAMVYRGMNIGTAKPSKELLSKIPHHLIDIREPSENYSAADFRRDALEAIEIIFSKNKIPLLVGGTMLYFKALFEGLSELPPANKKVREQLQEEAEKKGWAVLHERLKKADPVSAKRIHPNDPQRVQRALEIYQITGQPMSELCALHQGEPLCYEWVNIAIAPLDRAILHQRIAQRFKRMLDGGFVEEVRALYDRGDLGSNCSAMRAVGYRQVLQYLSGELTFDEMKEKAIIATRQLAKRQLTWLKHWPNIHWFRNDEFEKVKSFIVQRFQ